MSKSISPEQLDQLADEASVSTETILKRLTGLPVKKRAAERADKVLRKAGLLATAKKGGAS